jgi:hypothetical protein
MEGAMGWKVGAGGASVAVVCLFTSAVQAQAPRYEVKGIAFGGQCTNYAGTSLDSQGRVLGYNDGRCATPPTARLWTSGDPNGQALATLPGAVLGCGPGAKDNASAAFDINGSRIAGHAATWDCEGPAAFRRKPVIWEGGTPRALPLPSGYTEGEGRAINARGDVVGRLLPSEDAAFWPIDGQPIVLGPVLGLDVNASRQIVGCRPNASGVFTPFLWQNQQAMPLPPSNWNDQRGCANAINDAGLIAGTSDNRPVLWQNGTLKRLAPAGFFGAAVDVNSSGKVVGHIGGMFFYSDGTNVWDLTNLIDDAASYAPSLQALVKLNDNNQIVLHRERQPWNDAPFPDVVLLTPKVPSGADPQAPTVTMSSPYNGEPLTDLVVLKASASDNVGVVGVQFYSFGKPVGPEDTTAPYTAEAEWDSIGPVNFYARARDAAGNFTSTPLRFATETNTCASARSGQTINGSIGTRTGQFTVRYTGTPQQALMDGGFGLAMGTPGGLSGTSASVLFAPDGQIKVRNGTSYVDTGVAYRVDVHHHFRVAVDVAARRYSVWLKFANEPEKLLATNAAFRGAAVTQLDHWIARTDEESPTGEITICNVRVP